MLIEIRSWLVVGVVLAVVFVASAGFAAVRLEGEWPAEERSVSLTTEQVPRSEALRRLAAAAGWSVVVDAPAPEPVTLQIENQTADKVLRLLLRDGEWVAHREGNLVAISRLGAPSAIASGQENSVPAPAMSSAPNPQEPAANEGQDRFVTAGEVVIGPNEVVADLAVLGGSVDIYGTVKGDLVLFGGAAVIRKSGKVMGDAAVLAGALDIEEGGEVLGDRFALAGTIRRNGEVLKNMPWDEPTGPWTVTRALAQIGSAIGRTALLFLFGAMLMALLTPRMQKLQLQVASQPLKTLAWGLLGFVIAALGMAVLVLTCIGLPLAVILAAVSLFAAGAGLVAVLSTIGAALVQHRYPSPYVHLAVGCALFLVASSMPFLGGLLTTLLMMVGLGAVVATRGADLFPRQRLSRTA